MILCENYQQQTEIPEISPLIEGLADAEACVLNAFSQALKPPPPLDFTVWAEENIIFDADNQFPGPYKPQLFPFFIKVLFCLQPDHPARIVVLMGSAQVGKTICAEVFAGASLDKDPGGIFYVHPTLDNAATWVRTKWKKFVLGSKALKRIFPWESRSRESTNTLLHKERHDGRGFLKVTGANSPSSLAMQTYRRQIHDDLAKWQNNEHGDPEDQADKRSQAWGDWAKILKISTPGILGICRITKNYKASNQQVYEVPCPHCDHWHHLEWENFKQSLHDGMEYSEAHFHCPECGGVIEHHHKEQMLDAAFAKGDAAWKALNPSSKTEGFYIWSAYSRLVSWAYIAEEWFKAKDDPEKEQTFMTDTVGVAYEQKGEAPPWKELRDRAKNSLYLAGSIPVGYPILTMGMDVQGDRIEWTLMAWGPQKRRAAVQAGIIEGHITEARVKKLLDNLIARKWKNSFGQMIGVDLTAIDANYETNEVKDWAKKHPKVITVKGSRNYTAAPMVPIKEERNNKGKLKKFQTKHWMVGVSGLKATLYKQLEKTDPLEPGYCAFPSDLEDEYFIQLASERRILQTNKKTQHSEYIWVKLPGIRNEELDKNIYAEAAARRIGWHTMSEASWDAIQAERERPLEHQQMDLLDPQNMIVPPADKPKQSSLADQLA